MLILILNITLKILKFKYWLFYPIIIVVFWDLNLSERKELHWRTVARTDYSSFENAKDTLVALRAIYYNKKNINNEACLLVRELQYF